MDSPKSPSPANDRKQFVFLAPNSYQTKERAWTETPPNALQVRTDIHICLVTDVKIPILFTSTIWENWITIVPYTRCKNSQLFY